MRNADSESRASAGARSCLIDRQARQRCALRPVQAVRPVTESVSWELPSMRRCITLLILLTCQHVGAQEPAAAPPILVLDSGGHTSIV